MKIDIIVLLIAIYSFILFSCGRNTGQTVETQTQGKIKISVDESFKLLIDTEIYTFQAFYKYAHIQAQYKPEIDVLNDLLADSVRAVVVTRDLNETEKNALKSSNIISRATLIAKDAIAFIVNKENTDSLFSFSQIGDLCKGKVDNWHLINKNSKLKEIKVVFDNIKSANVRYLNNKFGLDGKFPSYFFAMKNNEEVIQFVKSNKNAIGIISVNWISDNQDSISNQFLKNITVAEIGSEASGYSPQYYYKPYPGYVADNSYPFVRKVFYISRETFSGLGSGFASFLAGEKGQLIVHRSGLVPATVPVRIIHLSK